MNITVLIPTYRRPTELKRCLEALQKQIRPANEVLIVVRDSDAETWTFLETFKPDSLLLRTTMVSVTGVVAAMNAGINTAQGDVVAITDDDAAPHIDWLARIEAHFLSHDCVGGVGGRDWMYHGTQLDNGSRRVVGQVQWFGRLIGNHHLGVGEPREVDVLKGVNCAYRSEPLRKIGFDTRLLGSGAQVHWEVSLGLAMRRAGFKLIYDPVVAVDHYEAQRWDEDRVGYFNCTTLAAFNSSYNETIVLLDHLPIAQQVVYIAWSFLIGTSQSPGILQAIRLTPKFKLLAWQRYITTQQGKLSALLSHSRISRNTQQNPDLSDTISYSRSARPNS